MSRRPPHCKLRSISSSLPGHTGPRAAAWAGKDDSPEASRGPHKDEGLQERTSASKGLDPPGVPGRAQTHHPPLQSPSPCPAEQAEHGQSHLKPGYHRTSWSTSTWTDLHLPCFLPLPSPATPVWALMGPPLLTLKKIKMCGYIPPSSSSLSPLVGTSH